MKKSSYYIIMAMLALPNMAQAQGDMSQYDQAKPLGWATVNGSVTGGNEENVVKVTTLSELKSALSGTDKKTIYVEGTIDFTSSLSVNSVQNKTIYGLPGSVLQNTQDPVSTKKSGILTFNSCKNIILRNLTFKSAGAYDMDGNDNLTFTGSTYMWVDHCDFQDGVDGNFDCTNGSDNVCVSWCRFRYLIAPWAGGSGGSDDHRNCNLWGSSDSKTSDKGKLKTTFICNWWDEGCHERMPRVRYGMVHVANCLYSSSETSYCIGAGYASNIYAEKNIFSSANAKKTPWKKYATKSKYTDFNITMKDNSGASDVQQKSGSNDFFIPTDYYTLTLQDPSVIEQDIRSYARATLPIVYERGVVSGISQTTVSNAEVVKTEYFTTAGVSVSQPQKGITIVRQKMSDGTTKTRKVMIK